MNNQQPLNPKPLAKKHLLAIQWLMLSCILVMMLSGGLATRYITQKVSENSEQNEIVLAMTEHIKGDAELISQQMLPVYQSLLAMDVSAYRHQAEFELYVLDSVRGKDKLVASLDTLLLSFPKNLDYMVVLTSEQKLILTELVDVFEDMTVEALEQNSPNRLNQLQLDSEDIFSEFHTILQEIRIALDDSVNASIKGINADLDTSAESVYLQKKMLSRLENASIWGLSVLLFSVLSAMAFLFFTLHGRLGAVADYAHAIADGKYDAVIGFISSDKIGEMAGSVSHMGSRMASLVEELREQADQALDAKKQALRLAYYDSLTGLPNRQNFLKKLEEQIYEANIHNTKVAVVYMDLDGFKKVNDSYGHGVGDQLLVAVADRLGNSIREDDSRSIAAGRLPELTPSRLGGDEFTFTLNQLHDRSEALTIIHRVLEGLGKPYSIGGRELFVTPSMGVALYPDDANNCSQLIKYSDMAMYHAKDSGKNTIKSYTREIGEQQARKLQLERDLWDALKRDEFVVYYQPKIDIASRKVVGVEALLRWHHPELGLIPPDLFIPIAEECGAIVPIGEWVIRQACNHLVEWRDIGLTPIPIAVNLSVKQISSEGLLPLVSECLLADDVCSGNIELELTESVLMEDINLAISVLSELNDLGVRISLDDFGTGYSSLSYLKRLPLSTLKIDRSFVSDIETDLDDAAIVEAILLLAKSLGLKVVAEGIETEMQYEFLKERGCDEGQGYLFSKPLPVEELITLLSVAEYQSIAQGQL